MNTEWDELQFEYDRLLGKQASERTNEDNQRIHDIEMALMQRFNLGEMP